MPSPPKNLVIPLSQWGKEHSVDVIAAETPITFKIAQPGQENLDCSFDGSKTFLDLAHISGIPELPLLLHEYRQVAADELSQQRSGMYHNEDKLGIWSLEQHDLDKIPPKILITFFRTDYFTHRILRLVWHHLQKVGHPTTAPSTQSLPHLQPFFTSLGVNALLVCHGSKPQS